MCVVCPFHVLYCLCMYMYVNVLVPVMFLRECMFCAVFLCACMRMCVCVCLCTCLKVCVIVYVWCARACFTCVRNRDPSLCYSLIFFQQLKLSSIFPHAHAHGIA
jgi:hypothetical protein